MKLSEIVNEWNGATSIGMPTISVTDCKFSDTDWDNESEKEYTYYSFPHYYKNTNGVEYDLVYEDYGECGFWQLYDHDSNESLATSDSAKGIMDNITL